ncbi:hypothetical protein [Opitutus terrae]|uniref:Lipoprotein n=1 Tax=Opitutus terrae (strain DSM 11246 / JCM 15787 / PB90-1) TaxID=452637 RepID=B1ZU00_OPITP|nr:hypothetical protein [Opitutus terrae]ACB75882.1 hypothetical protein Oter_2600 [Opitutus terrae PB90-1]
MKLLVCGVSVLLVCGCNSVNQQAVNSFIDAGNASIQGSTSLKGSGLFPRKQMYWVAKIDGEAVKAPGYFRAYALSPGQRSVVAGGGLFQGHLGSHDTLGGEAEFSLEAKPGHKYEVRGDVIDQQLSIHIFDLTTNLAATPSVQPAVHAEKHKDPILILIPVL